MPDPVSKRLESTRPSRRDFLKQTTAALAGTLAAPAFLRGRDLNSKLRIAVIGAGGRGAANLEGVANEEIVALCDVFEPAIAQAAKRLPKAKKYRDFRKLYEHSNDFDAVVVSTSEHTHAFATLPALQLGKHVYCEKPLTHSIWEARAIREAAAKANVTTQMGIQIHSFANYRRVVELIQSGAIGPVREVHVWVNRAWGWHPTEEEAKRHQDLVFTSDRPKGSSPIPAGLDWDLWLGPAPARPFHEVYLPGPKWYRWWDFANGTMSDLGAHWNDLPFWALKLQAPQSVVAAGPPVHPELAPASMQATYEYAARGDLPPVTLTWYQGDNQPPLLKEKKIPQQASGVLFVGDKGMLLSNYGKHVLLPEENFRDFKRPEPTLPTPTNHYTDWLDACKAGKQASANFEYAGWLTEANHLGVIAYRAGTKLEWDPAQMRFTNNPDANRFIRREYRNGWKLA